MAIPSMSMVVSSPVVPIKHRLQSRGDGLPAIHAYMLRQGSSTRSCKVMMTDISCKVMIIDGQCSRSCKVMIIHEQCGKGDQTVPVEHEATFHRGHHGHNYQIVIIIRPLDWGGSSFFKVMEPNSFSCLGIPPDFVKRMQCGACKDAILQGPSGHLWHVNLCCANTWASFTDGWESFVSDQFIEVGDILVFRHVDDVLFAVHVFGPSGCEKQSAFSFQNYTSCCLGKRNLNLSTICNKKMCEHRQISTTASVSLLIDIKPNRNGDITAKDLKMDHTLTGTNSGQSNSPRNLPEFSVVLPKSAVTDQYRMYVPREFVNRWMRKRSFQVRLLCEKKSDSWEVLFKTFKIWSGFTSGWKAFAISNGLQVGDKCVFKLLDELHYIFDVHVIKHGLHDDCGGRQKKRNVTNAHEKMKTSVVNPNHSMDEYKAVVGYESQSPVQVTCTRGLEQKSKIEVIGLD